MLLCFLTPIFSVLLMYGCFCGKLFLSVSNFSVFLFPVVLDDLIDVVDFTSILCFLRCRKADIYMVIYFRYVTSVAVFLDFLHI